MREAAREGERGRERKGGREGERSLASASTHSLPSSHVIPRLASQVDECSAPVRRRRVQRKVAGKCLAARQRG